MDLLNLWRRRPDGRPVLTLRRVYVLIQHLPTDSATHFYLFGPVARWGPTEHLLADLWEVFKNRGAKRHQIVKYPRPTAREPKALTRARKESKRAKLLRQRERYVQPD